MDREYEQLINELKKLGQILKSIDYKISDLKGIERLEVSREEPLVVKGLDRILSVKETAKVLGVSCSPCI